MKKLFKLLVLKIERMVLKKEFNLESIITKNGIRILRLMIKRPYLSYGLSELSSSLGISKSNILGYLRVLQKNNLVRTEKEGKKKTYKINSSLEIMQLLWLLFMNEKKNNLRPASKNIVDYIFNKVKDKAEVFILFGSVAYGLEQEGSDIDILVVGDKRIKEEKLDIFPKRVEFHLVTKEQLEKMQDFVLLEAIMNGIVYKGDIFRLVTNLKWFPKLYVLFRLHKAKEHLAKASKLKGHAKEYYKELARVSLGEIEALLFKKQILPKKLIKLTSTIEFLEEKISKEGEQIWLT